MQHAHIPASRDTLPVAGIPPTDVRAVLDDSLARARLLMGGLDETTAAETACRLIEIAVAAFWQCHAPVEQLRSPFHTKTQATVSREAAFAERFGAAAGSLGLDAACDALGRFYATMLPSGLRATHGIYYTPPPLAQLLLRRATGDGTDWATARVLDPACGAGAILLPTLRRMLDARGEEDPKKTLAHVRDHLRGTDLDPVAAWLCQVMIDAALLPWGPD
jgi:adenine-specific DNA-methyltransferase